MTISGSTADAYYRDEAKLGAALAKALNQEVLALAAAGCTWIQIDERSAGFFALGLAQRQQLPVILICTSGSAVTHWFPAVVEASHSYTPLLLLSADRPQQLQNCGANQTINQKSLSPTKVAVMNHRH